MSQFTITEEIKADADTVLYRGYRNSDRAPVSVKLLRRSQESPREAAKLRYEYMMMRDLELPGVVAAYGIEQHENGLALVMDDLGEQTLSDVLSTQRLDLATALKLAASAAETLDALHRRQIIHKNINPHNVLVNMSTGAARLRDFGAATRLSQELQPAQSPASLEGSLPYISPEQTGRMNRTLDHRTDLYSLGVMFYQMATGRLPFQAADPMEMVHSHIARRPTPPQEISPEIPKVVSDIIMKLLSKPAEDRYQSAFGLVSDLRECLAQLEATGSIAPFPLGRRDLSGELRIPQRLYGREADTRELLLAHDRVSQGGVELLLVAGFSGIGKSVLVNEVHKPIAARGGAFISGKFDLLNRSVPYAPLANAFRELTRSYLQGSAEELAALKERLLHALDHNAQLLIDLIPELALILGPQPSVPELAPTEAQNRFALVFQRFIRVFVTAGRPLVLFLDDLQWADSASLKLLQTVLTNPENAYLLVLGAYRDNEVGPAHPLSLTIDDMKKLGARLSEITLKPLTPPTVTELLCDTFNASEDRIAPLSEIIFEKTQGNPFFMTQLLGALHRDKLIGWSAGAGVWEWDLEGIRGAGITDNVVELMVGKIQRLSPSTQRILQLGACIGHQFDLKTLSIIYEKTPASAAADLWEALREGILVPLTAEYRFLYPLSAEAADEPADLGALRVAYKFLHDRVQQAAYSMIDEARRQEIHLQIGRLLRESRGGDSEDVFRIVHHTNIGAALITDRSEQLEMARLNLVAGRKAKAATAFQTAAGYFAAGVRLLGEAGWEDDYETTLATSAELAECEYLNGHLEQAEALFDVLLSRAKTNVERGEIYNLRMVLYGGQVRYAEGREVGRTALALFGINMPESEEECGPLLGAELAEVPQNLRGRTLDEVLNGPMMTDPEQRIALKILGNMFIQAFIGHPVLCALTCVKQANIALKYGHSNEAPFAYVLYGFVLAAIGQFQAAYDFGRLAVDLSEKYNTISVKCRLHLIFSMHESFGRKPFRLSLEHARKAIRFGPESGDLNFLSYAICQIGWTRSVMGDEVGAVLEEIEKYLPLVRQTYNPGSILNTLVGRQLYACLLGRTSGPQSFTDDTVNEAELVERLQAPEVAGAWGWYNSCKLRVALLNEDYAGALKAGTIADGLASSSTGLAFTLDQAFHLCLVILLLPPEETRAQAIQEMFARDRAKLAAYAEGCPENFLHKRLLVEAEEARAAGKLIEAMDLYDKSIQSAEANGFIHDAALASELAAKFYARMGREKVAGVYMAEAHRRYRAWGAATKVAQIEQKYGALLGAGARAPSASEKLQRLAGPSGVDLMTVVKAAQALSDEIDLTRLLQKLMRITIENAGAEKGYLIREQGGGLLLEAEATADKNEVTVFRPAAALSAAAAPLSILGHVRRTRESVVLDDAAAEKRFSDDEYIAAKRAKSVLCLPLLRQAELVGLLYLENNLTSGAFTAERISTLDLLASQAAISLENARLYSELSRENAERRRAEQEVRELNAELELRIQDRTAQLQVANKELEAFSYSVSHDLRAPLRVIDGFSLALQEDHGDKLDDDARDSLSRVRWASKRMSELIDDMLKLARVARAEMRREPIDMSGLASEVLGDLKRAHPERDVECVVAEGVTATGDRQLLKIALENLLGNAWKFTGKRPRARIELGTKVSDGGGVAYFVRDNGAGFDMKYAGKMFGTFQRLHAEDDFSGTGVGLATVQRIVARHGGRIWAEGEVDKGATFYFTL